MEPKTEQSKEWLKKKMKQWNSNGYDALTEFRRQYELAFIKPEGNMADNNESKRCAKCGSTDLSFSVIPGCYECRSCGLEGSKLVDEKIEEKKRAEMVMLEMRQSALVTLQNKLGQKKQTLLERFMQWIILRFFKVTLTEWEVKRLHDQFENLRLMRKAGTLKDYEGQVTMCRDRNGTLHTTYKTQPNFEVNYVKIDFKYDPNKEEKK